MSNLQKEDFFVTENEIGFIVMCEDKMIYCGTEEQCEAERDNAWDEYHDSIAEALAFAEERDLY